jgi:hypothetical protein
MNVWETDLKNLAILRRARLATALAIAAILAGCGGGGDGAATAPTSRVDGDATPALVAPPASGAAVNTGPSATSAVVSTSATTVTVVPTTKPVTTVAAENPAPQIFGSAATTAKVGQSYSFQPSATDADHHALTFSVSNAPDWLTFNAATGRLFGTPTSADIGTDRGMVLVVSNGTSSARLAAFSITVVAAGSSSGNVSLSWQPPTENTNGSALLDLAGYVIHYGSASKTYTSAITITNPGLTSYVVEDLPAGTYYFSMTSTSTSGEESALSTEASATTT